MKNHVTSLELSKKLKELGVEQESEFIWDVTMKGEYVLAPKDGLKLSYFREKPTCSAFLASELGEMLPDGKDYKFQKGTRPVSLSIGKTWNSEQYFVSYMDYGRDRRNYCDECMKKEEEFYDIAKHEPCRSLAQHDKTLPNAMAKMLIHLKT